MSEAERPLAGVFGFITSRPVAVAMVFVTMLAFGWKSLGQLSMSLLPDISYPTVTVRAEYPGAAPEDVEERVTKRLHESLSVLARLESISSVSRAEFADVTLEFTWGTQLTYAIQDIRERLDRTNLPLEVGTPIILRFDPTLDPIMAFGLTGGRDLVALRTLAEDRLSTALSTIEGVAAVRVRGGQEDEIQVRLQADKLATFGLASAEIAARLAAENVNLASGTVLEGDTEYLVRILNEYRTPEEISRTILMRQGDSVVRLADVAEVRRATKERDVITRIGGEESVELQIFKEADANIVELAERVRDAALGTPEQQAWVARLRSGEQADPEEALAEFRAKVAADPLRLAAMERVQAARLAMARGGEGGGPSGRAEAEASSSGAAPADTRSAAEIALDTELATEFDQLQADLRTHAASTAFLAAQLPSDVTVHLLSDQSRFIESAIHEVSDSALMGAVLSVIVLYLFLRNLTATLIIAVSIPISVVVSFTPLHLSGTTLNVMSLGGLALGIGMLVDNAIVVLDSIARFRENGHSRIQAAVLGTQEVAAAVVASTLTTVAVFAPIVFVEGIAGQIFRDQALTVVVSLLASLLVSLYLVPMLASRGSDTEGREFSLAQSGKGMRQMLFRPWPALAILAPPAGTQRSWWSWFYRPFGFLILIVIDAVGRLLFLVAGILFGSVLLMLQVLGLLFRGIMWLPTKLFGAGYDSLSQHYPRFIHGIVLSGPARTLVLAASVALFAGVVWIGDELGSELLPEVHQGEIVARLSMPVGTPLESTAAVCESVEALLAAHPRVAWFSVTAGVPRDEISEPDEGEHTARIAIGLLPAKDMAAEEEAVMTDVRALLAGRPDLRDLRFQRPTLFTVRAPLQVEIKGDDLSEIAAAAQQVEAGLRELPGLRDVRSSVQPGSPEVLLSFDRDLLSRYGLDTRQVATTVANMVQGTVPTQFTDAEHKLDVLVHMDKAQLTSLEELMNLPADPSGAAGGPLSALTRVQVREGPREVRRIWGQRAAVVEASLQGFDIGHATAAIEQTVQGIEQAGTLTIEMGGQGREMEGALGQMGQALLLAVFLVYVVMASIFESLLQPLLILITVPLAAVGAVGALWLLDIPLSVVVFIGGIILAGIVVNNAIVLIDAINRRRRLDGLPLDEAVRDACATRLRPIFMTTLTTVLGLLPLTGWLPMTAGEGTELRAPMAITVVAGLTVSTLLTLIVIPTLYAVVEDALERARARRGAREVQSRA
ncbi:MAG: efflux RND transporter permease subunit [Planctomycetota bacterium]